MAGINWYHTNRSDENCSVDVQLPICSLADVQLRFLCPTDLDEVRALCQEWFPIEYPITWYEEITSSQRFYALAAVYNQVIVGLIVAEIKPYRILNEEDSGILAKAFVKTSDVGYILSLGVAKQYRRNGIATLLLDSLINQLTTLEKRKVKAIFLHVLTTNSAAILFYEHRKFQLHKFLPYYYSINGRCKDGFTYVLYINGGHPPWGLCDYLKFLFSTIAKGGGLFTWIFGKIHSAIFWIRNPRMIRQRPEL
ncbi:N-alpha-acetyltransferase 60 [Photinus pyralis]|nr:N-alpha-acetyltransferase 60 [Photinus pyralis]